MAIRLLDSVPGFKIGSVGPVVVSVWNGPASEQMFDLMEKHYAEVARSLSRLYTVKVVTKLDLAARSLELSKRRGMALADTYDDRMVGQATAILPNGGGADVVRSFTQSFNLLRKRKAPSGVFANLKDMADLMDRLNGTPRLPDAQTLLRDLHAFCAVSDAEGASL